MAEENNEPELILVFADTAGHLYEISRATLERCRVPDHRKAEVQEAMRNIQSVSSYINNPRIPGAIVASYVLLAPVQYAGSYLNGGESGS